MARRGFVAVHVATLLVAAIFAEGAVAMSSNDNRGLELVASSTRTVRFVAGEGRAVLVLRNVSRRAGRLRLAYVSVSGDRFTASPHRPGQGPPALSLRDPQSLRRPLAAGATRRIELRLRLAPDQAPADGGGRVEVRISTGDGTPITMAIRGAAPDISFDPVTLTINVRKGCWLIGPACGGTETVLLRGRDAILWARRTPNPSGIVILNNHHGGAVTVRLRDVDVRDGAVRATIATDDLNEAGRYEGRLPIEPNGLAGPSLAVHVAVRWSLATAVIVIFGGALFGGFFLRRFEIRRRQRLLELELLSALGRYDEERARSGDRPAGYDMEPLLEPRRQDAAATLPYPGTRGVSALLWHIKTARDGADFSEDTARTHALIAAIERWLALEPVARETAQLLDGEAPPSRSGVELADTIAYRDLAHLRMRATTAPEDDDDCEALIGALAAQGRVAVRCKVMWELLSDLESRNGYRLDQARVILDLDVLALERQYPAFKHRTAEQTDQLLVALGHAEDRLRRLYGDVGTLDSRPRVVEARYIEHRLGVPARKPVIERGMLDLSPWRLRLAGAFSALALRSIVWTLARALVAAAAYALIIYSDTWGSVNDFASAFTAGFLTETVVNWAVMPAFRTNRNRSDVIASGPAAQPPAGDTGPPPVACVPATDTGPPPKRPQLTAELPASCPESAGTP
jgi:hypothetical protein